MASASVKYETVDPKDFKAVFGRTDTESSLESPNTARNDRQDELVRLFKIPPHECLVDDFVCAWRRTVLYQGRLYVFEHFACFHSHIFNHHKVLVIPLKDVTQIRKKKMYGFPNSIEIVWKGKRESFASFLKRDSAHRLLLYAWSKSTPYAKLFGGVNEGSSQSSSPRAGAGHNHSSKKVLGSVRLGKLMYRKGENQGQGESQGHLSSASPDSHDEELSGTDDEKAHPVARENLDADSLTEAHSHISEPGSHASDSEDEEGSQGEGLESWVPADEEATPPDPSMTVMAETNFELPVRDFYKEFLSEQSQFFITWHETRGDTKVQLSEWHKHPNGRVRELTFITPLKQKIGPSKCLCTQTQRARLHPGDHIVFETSQIMDIPYGDHFAVEARWDVTPVKQKQCKVEVRLAIPFSKRTIFRNTIESSTKALMKEACEDWISTAHRWLEPPIPMRSVFDGQESSSGDDFQEPTHLSRSQSLAMRLSTDRMPDVDGLLLRAPSTARSDIARMLQLQRKDTDRKLNNSLSFGRSRLKSVSFEVPEEQGLAGPLRGKALVIVCCMIVSLLVN